MCAVLVGKTFTATKDRELHGPIPQGYDSATPTFTPEYVVKNVDRVLPHYLNHLDKGVNHSLTIEKEPIKTQSRGAPRINPAFSKVTTLRDSKEPAAKKLAIQAKVEKHGLAGRVVQERLTRGDDLEPNDDTEVDKTRKETRLGRKL